MKKRFSALITLFILVLLFLVLRNIDFYQTYKLLWKINIFYFILAFFSGLFSFVIWNFRWKKSISTIVKGNFWFLFSVLFAGIFLNTITPGTTIGGEPIRAQMLNQKYKKSKSKFFGIIIADKFFNLLIFYFLVVFSLFFIIFFIKIPSSIKIMLEIFLFLIFIFTGFSFYLILKGVSIDSTRFIRWIYFLKFIRKRFKNRKEFVLYLQKRLTNFSNSFKKVIINKNVFLFGIISTSFIWLFIFLMSYFLFLSFGVKINFLFVIVVVTLGYLIGDLSPIPGGIGLVEGTMIILFSAVGINIELSTLVTLLSRMIYYFYAIFIGGLNLVYLKITLK